MTVKSSVEHTKPVTCSSAFLLHGWWQQQSRNGLPAILATLRQTAHMKVRVMHLEPFSHFVRSMRSAPMTWHNALAELIDNALDSDASRVDIKMEGKAATILDDGNGCENVEAMLTLGGHVRQSDSGVGLYGRGLKDAWFWMSNCLHLDTNHRGVKRRCVIDALSLEQSNWQADDPDVSTTTDIGTSLHFPDLLRRLPNKKVIDQLALTFSPATSTGKIISVQLDGKRKKLKPFILPSRTDRVIDEFIVDGRTVAIDIGIVSPGVANSTDGLFLTYRHRVLTETAIGTGDFSCSRLAGSIILIGDGWRPGPNKDCLDDTQVDDLESAIFARICSIARQAHEQGEVAECDAFVEEVEAHVAGSAKSLAKKREKRRTGTSHGTSQPKDTGRERQTAAQVTDNPGSVLVDESVKTTRKLPFKIETSRKGKDGMMATADLNGKRVKVNLDHPYINKIWGDNVEAVVCVVFGTWCAARFATADACGHWSDALKTASLRRESSNA